LRAEADAIAPAGVSRGALARFLYKRCQAHGQLGEFHQAAADCEKSVEYAEGSVDLLDLGRIRQGLAVQYSASGDPKKALQVQLKSTQIFGAQRQGFLFNIHAHIVENYVQLGDFSQAEVYVRKNQALIEVATGWRQYANPFRRVAWASEVDHARARLYEARGQFREAESSYQRAENLQRESIRLLHTYEGLPPPLDQLQQGIDFKVAAQGRMKAR
jgi:tetratricopeptide (TPR) repeat protein